MNPEISLCSHLLERALTRLEPAADDLLEWNDGPVVAVVRCAQCSAVALAVLLDWSRSRRVRVFGLAALPEATLALYRRNVARGSCDLGRASLEQQALFAATGPAQRLLVLDTASGEVVDWRPLPGRAGLPDEPWAERVPPVTDDRFFAEAGLSKNAL